MKKIAFIFSLILLILSCKKTDHPSSVELRDSMRAFVIGISNYAKSIDNDFLIIPQNGIELVTKSGEITDAISTNYINAIDGHGQEDLFYGYNNDDEITPTEESEYLQEFLDLSLNQGNSILVTDYCSTPSKMDDAFNKCISNSYISFGAEDRELKIISSYPSPIRNENNHDILELADAKNFLYLINPSDFSSKQDFIQNVNTTNFDLIIMDLFFTDNLAFTATEINALKTKANGGSRLLVCYMSIGEAEDYRYYWNSDWSVKKTEWLEEENPDWEGNYKVQYWHEEWQNIIYGEENSYLKKIIDTSFDGVYLDIIDAYEYFE